MIINVDEMGIKLVPSPGYSLAQKGSKDVNGTVKGAVAQITKISGITKSGEMLPYLLIFAGKTETVLPTEVEPANGSVYSCTPSHFANTDIILEYVAKIIIPYVNSCRTSHAEGENGTEWAVLIWDNFSAHQNELVTALLTSNCIKPMYLPPKCTSKYQPLDVLVNGVDKGLIKKHFGQWHFQQALLKSTPQQPCLDALPKTAHGKRRLIAQIIRQVHNIMTGRRDLIMRAWACADLFSEGGQAVPPMDSEIDDRLANAAARELSAMSFDEEVAHDLDELRLELDLMDSTAADYEENLNLCDLDTTPEDDREEKEGYCNDMDYIDDSDTDSSYAPSSSSSNAVLHIAAADMDENRFVGTVSLTRIVGGGAIAAIFEKNSRTLSHGELFDLLKTRICQKLGSGIKEHQITLRQYEKIQNGYRMTLDGVSHSVVADRLASVSWTRSEDLRIRASDTNL